MTSPTVHKSCALAAVLLAIVVFSPVMHAQTFTVLHTFVEGGDGMNPAGSLMRTAGGVIYGTTQFGGTGTCSGVPGCGTVFGVDIAGDLKIIYNFVGGKDGSGPEGELFFDAAGALYGTTRTGGDSTCGSAAGCGTVFKIDAKGNESVVHAFTGSPDGRDPYFSGLSADAKGNLYGTTYNGGNTACPLGCGVIFRIDTKGRESLPYSFTGQTDGANPAGGVLWNAGLLFGTTYHGGDPSCDCGTVFKLNGPTESVLHSFTLGDDGGLPYASVKPDPAGGFYGTTGGGGVGGFGTVFTLGTGGKETALYSFTGGSDGSLPFSGVIRDKSGNFYGTTYYGGTYGNGVVFKVDAAGNETVLHNFTGGSDGSNPVGALVMDVAGNLYGTTYYGGDSICGCGVVFKIVP